MPGQFFIVESRHHLLGEGDGRLEAHLDRPPDPEWVAAFEETTDAQLVLRRDLIIANAGARSTVEDVVTRVNAMVTGIGSRAAS